MEYLREHRLILAENLSKYLEEQSCQKIISYLRYYPFLHIENNKPEELLGKSRPRILLENSSNFHYW